MTLSAFQKKVVKFWTANIKPRLGEVNVTMLATQYGNIPKQVQVHLASTKKTSNAKLNELMDLFKQMMAGKASNAGDDCKPAASSTGQGKVPVCSNCNKQGHSITNCWEKGGRKEGMRPDPMTIKCRKCGEMGHYVSQCPLKQKKEHQKVTHVQWSNNDDNDSKDKLDGLIVGTITH